MGYARLFHLSPSPKGEVFFGTKKAHFTVLVEALVMNSRWTANLREMMDDMHKALGPRLSLNIFEFSRAISRSERSPSRAFSS